MEIGTLQESEREGLLDLLDGWGLADGWAGRDFFRRYIECDPTYADENVWVARERGELLSCVQIFPRRIRVLGYQVSAGGIGSVFTRRDRRSEGLAGALLEGAAAAMRERGMSVSLLFSGRIPFYEKYGYSSWKSQRALVKRSGKPPGTARARPLSGARRQAGGALEIRSFDAARDWPGVEVLHEGYSSERSGSVVRDAELWRASFLLAGNPDERFLVARRGGELAAYLRSTKLYERHVVTELARVPGDPEALAALVDASLAAEPREGRAADAPSSSADAFSSARADSGPDAGSNALPDDLMLPAFDDLELTLALEQAGISSHPLDDPTSMLRCIDGARLADEIGAPMHEDETDQQFLQRTLPADAFVFWPADRF